MKAPQDKGTKHTSGAKAHPLLKLEMSGLNRLRKKA